MIRRRRPLWGFSSSWSKKSISGNLSVLFSFQLISWSSVLSILGPLGELSVWDHPSTLSEFPLSSYWDSLTFKFVSLLTYPFALFGRILQWLPRNCIYLLCVWFWIHICLMGRWRILGQMFCFWNFEISLSSSPCLLVAIGIDVLIFVTCAHL